MEIYTGDLAPTYAGITASERDPWWRDKPTDKDTEMKADDELAARYAETKAKILKDMLAEQVESAKVALQKRVELRDALNKEIHNPRVGELHPNTPPSRDPDASQIGGLHYSKLRIQPWNLWWQLDLDPFQAVILKYLLRWKTKHAGDPDRQKQDLMKALHTLEKYISIADEYITKER